MGSLTIPTAMEKKFLGFEDGRLFNPSLCKFSFASAEIKPVNFPEVMFWFIFIFSNFT